MNSPTEPGLDVNQHNFDDLDKLVAQAGTSAVQLYNRGYPIAACKELLRAARHAGCAARLVSDRLRLEGEPEPRPVRGRWTKELAGGDLPRGVRCS